MPKVSRGVPVSGSIPITPSRSPNRRLAAPCNPDSPSTAVTATNATQRQREVFRRAETQRDLQHERRAHCQCHRRQRAGDERADGGRRQCRAGAPCAGHRVALHRGHHRRALARRIQQDRRRRSAVHAAVVNASEHDERRRRVERVGNRKKQREGQARDRSPAARRSQSRGSHRRAPTAGAAASAQRQKPFARSANHGSATPSPNVNVL